MVNFIANCQLFSRDNRQSVMEANPEGSIREIGEQLARMFAAASAEERAEYQKIISGW